MAAQLPAALKAADIPRFVRRAAQVEKAKPIVAYWCDYWVVNQILSKGLHNADQEALVYTTTLMDKLEQFKSQNAEEAAVTDDMAGKAYVEQFGLDTFSRADNAVRANKASLQTADTFNAASTFLDLLQIWGPIDPEVKKKILYAKVHAARIAKAVKAGEDPNLSNPVSQPQTEESMPELDPNDPDVQMLQGGSTKPRQPSVVEVPDDTDRIQKGLAARSSLDESLHPSRDTSRPPPPDTRARQPSVTEVPDEADKLQSNLARQSSLNESLHPSRAPSIPRPPANDVSPLAAQDAASFYTNQNGQSAVSPLESPSERKSSIGGNYFPRVPSPTSKPAAEENTTSLLDLPEAPSEPHIPHPAPTHHHGHFLPQPQIQPTDPSAPPTIPPNFAPDPKIKQPTPHVPPQLRQPPQSQPQPIVPLPFAANAPTSIPPQSQTHPPPPQPNAVVDEEAMMKAQKHARWAISALNFEDVPTAIRELRGALAELGAS